MLLFCDTKCVIARCSLKHTLAIQHRYKVTLRVYTPIYSESTVMYFCEKGVSNPGMPDLYSWIIMSNLKEVHYGKDLLCVLTHGVCAQREAMTTIGVFKHRPDLNQLSLDLMTLLGSVFAAALDGGGTPPHAGGVQAWGSAVGKTNV